MRVRKELEAPHLAGPDGAAAQAFGGGTSPPLLNVRNGTFLSEVSHRKSLWNFLLRFAR